MIPKRIIRVFPKRTSFTPRDEYAFVGDPPLIRPEADEVHISCSFTWDQDEAERLRRAWGQYYAIVKIGGMSCFDNDFMPGFYIRRRITFTSRGCNNQCPWCLVPEREGKLRQIEIQQGNKVQDNNLLHCNKEHINKVIDMLRSQRAIEFSGGLDSRLLTNSVADDLKSLRIYQLFLACDTKESIRPLEKAKEKLNGFRRDQLRCYVLLAFKGESISEAIERLQAVWDLGFMPFAQLYQPPDQYIQYSKEWRSLARTWSRPAAMKAKANEATNVYNQY